MRRFLSWVVLVATLMTVSLSSPVFATEHATEASYSLSIEERIENAKEELKSVSEGAQRESGGITRRDAAAFLLGIVFTCALMALVLATKRNSFGSESTRGVNMDITLERILSLLPRKPDGKYVHGSKKALADTLNLPHNIVMEWESGKSRSYRNYLYQIADKHNVSVEWLKGETDIKEKPAPKGELSGGDAELIELFKSAPEWKKKAALALLRAAEEE